MGAEQSRGAGTTNGVANGGTAVPHGVSTLGPNLQKRFSKGIQYNMKVVIKGDRNVGKTCLFHRLQGQPYLQEYVPTPEIQVACIQWNYKVTDDVVKVEIWDIVDKGKTKKREGLKIQDTAEEVAPTLDAEFIDVYKGTSGVIMMLDITKYWTYEYVQRELPKVPLDIPIIIMASHRDMEEKRSVLTEDVKCFIQELNRPPHAAAVYYMEAAMADGFGLKYLYRFFNVPFLELQRQTLLAQLRRNEEDLEAIKVELDVHSKTEEQDYDRFKEMLERKRKGIPAVGGLCTVAAGANETADQSNPSSEGTDVSALEDGTTMSLRSRLSEKVLQNTPLPAKGTHLEVNKQRIDNFVPEGKLDNSFLSSQPSREPSPKPHRHTRNIADVVISDSDEELPANPQVTLDQESPDEEDLAGVYKQSAGAPASESESEAGEPLVMADVEGPEVVYNVPLKPAKTSTSTKASLPKTQTVIISPAPLQSIDPVTQPSHSILEPISYEPDIDKHEYEAFGSDLSSPEAASIKSVASSNEAVTRDNTVVTRDTDNSVTSSEVLKPSPEVHSSEDQSEEIVSVQESEMSEEAPPPQPIITPYLDLDVLDQISKAPPIEISKPKSPKLSKRDKSSSPKPKRSPKKSPKAPKKLAPPKKNLLDISLTSSDEDEEDLSPTEPVKPVVEVLASFDEPEPVVRKPTDYSLKLTHIEPEILKPEPEVPVKTITPPQKKTPKVRSVDREKARNEQNELDAFFGEPISGPKEPKKTGTKKKTKKKKKKANAVPTGDYEEF